MTGEARGSDWIDRDTAFPVMATGRCATRRMHLARVLGARGRVTARTGGFCRVVIGVTRRAIARHLLLLPGGMTGAALEAIVARMRERERPGRGLRKDRQRKERRQLLRSA